MQYFHFPSFGNYLYADVCFGSKAAAQVRFDTSISVSASGVKQPLATHRMTLNLAKTEISQADAAECLLFPISDAQSIEIQQI